MAHPMNPIISIAENELVAGDEVVDIVVVVSVVVVSSVVVLFMLEHNSHMQFSKISEIL